MIFKIIQIYERYDGANIIDKLNNTELSLKLFHIQSKEFGNNKCYGETTQLEKWQSEISPDIKKEMEDSRLNATDKTTDSVRKRPTEFLAARLQQRLKGPQSATPLFLFTCESLAIIFSSEYVETKEITSYESTKDN